MSFVHHISPSSFDGHNSKLHLPSINNTGKNEFSSKCSIIRTCKLCFRSVTIILNILSILPILLMGVSGVLRVLKERTIIFMGAQSIKRRFWMSLFEEKAQLPDMKVKEFCQSRNVTEKSYWYFHKRLSDEMEEKLYDKENLPAFLELKSEDLLSNSINGVQGNTGTVEIRSLNKAISISINENISDQFLLRIMRALNNV